MSLEILVRWGLFSSSVCKLYMLNLPRIGCNKCYDELMGLLQAGWQSGCATVPLPPCFSLPLCFSLPSMLPNLLLPPSLSEGALAPLSPLIIPSNSMSFSKFILFIDWWLGEAQYRFNISPKLPIAVDLPFMARWLLVFQPHRISHTAQLPTSLTMEYSSHAGWHIIFSQFQPT